MAKSTSYIRQNKQTSAMSPPHAHTSGLVSSTHHLEEEDDDDDDICPICEGACTCNNKTAPPIPAPFASSSHQTHIQLSPQSIPSPSVHAYPATPAPLKIKLTIPATLLSRSRCPTSDDPTAPSKKQNKCKDAYSRTNRHARPPKTAGRSTVHPAATSKAKNKRVPKPTSSAKDMTGGSSKSKKVGDCDDSRGGADSTPLRRSHGTAARNPTKPNKQFVQNQGFPTFVSADEFSSANESSAGSSSSSEESELTEFSDSSIAEEEEIFIRTTEEQRARAHDKARIKRELLGDGVANRKERRNDWEIRSRKKSVGPSDDDMDVDSDETDDEAENIEEAEGNDGEDEDEDDVGPVRGSYVGIATGWSEDEESSFDADLFFAGLSDSDSGPEITTVPDQDAATENDSSVDIGSSVLAQGTFEITEGWDGSVIFTNGLQDGQGLLDWDFEANAAQLLIEAGTTSESNSGSDIRMAESEGDMGDSEDETDGLEEVESNDGNTTEEELVDERGLPTARAMRLFRCPVTPLYAIDPLSTMNLGPLVDDLSNQSPRPSDILADREFVDEDEDAPEPPMSEISSIILSASSDRGTPRLPVMGMFEASKTDSLHRAIIDETRPAVPSPFQRSGRRRPSESASARSFTRGRDRSLSMSHASFATTPAPFGFSDEPTLLTSPSLPPAEPIRLDDVLDTSILDSDTADVLTTLVQPRDTIGDPEASATDDGERYLQSLSRWDRIPMGTFRRTRENGPLSDGAGELAFGSIIRNSPFNAVWPSDRNHGQPSGSPSKKGKGKKRGSQTRMDMDISPVILPVRDRDGDHTPTGHATGQTSHGPLHSKPRKDKESRRDKMLKRKTLMGTSIGRRHQQHHHPHSHHPNSKGRASGSMQRTGVFSGGSVPPLNL